MFYFTGYCCSFYTYIFFNTLFLVHNIYTKKKKKNRFILNIFILVSILCRIVDILGSNDTIKRLEFQPKDKSHLLK